MISTSKDANPNYLGKVVELKGLQKHPNADRLQTINIDFQTVVTGMDAKEGDFYVYFPVECAINTDFLAATNSFREAELNVDPAQKGFFEKHGRVKAVRLRGIPSSGYIVPVDVVENFTGVSNLAKYAGQEFDTIGDFLMLTKYVPKNSRTQGLGSAKQGKSPKVSRLIEGQVHLHVDTAQLRKNIHQISPNDQISVTYKTHGTSWWVSNVLVKRKLNWIERMLQKFGVKIQDTEYDHIYGSRKVVKNQHLEDPKAKDHFYGYDIWGEINERVKAFIPKGYTLYGEAIGYDKNGGYIQGNYDYACKPGDFKIEVYRITQTNADGLVTELNNAQIREFCGMTGLTPSHLYFEGKARDMYPELATDSHWHENVLRNLERDYNEKNCFMCENTVPEEGIVLRKENLFACEAFKLKSFAFLERESKELDSGVADIESEN